MNETSTSPEATKAPESVGWYIELTKWLIGISAGVLVFGFDKLHLPAVTGILRYGFWVSVGLLGISIGVGILCCMQFLAYANRMESGARHNETADDVKGFRDLGSIFFQWCAGSLWFGIVIFGLVWAFSVMNGRGTEASSSAPIILAFPEHASALILKPDAKLGDSSLLVRDKDGKYSWQAVHVPAIRDSPSTPDGK